MQEISWLAEDLLVSQEGVYSMESVQWINVGITVLI
jgi:hypothetical protein